MLTNWTKSNHHLDIPNLPEENIQINNVLKERQFFWTHSLRATSIVNWNIE